MNTPQQVIEKTYEMAAKKCSYSLSKTLTMSAMAGAYLSMGAALSILAGFGFPDAAAGNPALSKILMGLAFPLGLALIMVLGADLFTGNTATIVPAMLQRRISVGSYARNITLVWIGNFIGSLIFAYFFVHLTGVLSGECWREGLESVAMGKCSNPMYKTFLKGIGANWFVCLAVWMSITSNTLVGKVVGVWLPVSAFVALGYEHSIANMFFIPTAMMQGADISIVTLFKNLIPATLGNIVGGALFVGGLYGALMGHKEKI